MATYKVTVQLPESIKATERIRAGIIVDRVCGYEGELSEEQVAEIQADAYLAIEELKVSKSATSK